MTNCAGETALRTQMGLLRKRARWMMVAAAISITMACIGLPILTRVAPNTDSVVMGCVLAAAFIAFVGSFYLDVTHTLKNADNKMDYWHEDHRILHDVAHRANQATDAGPNLGHSGYELLTALRQGITRKQDCYGLQLIVRQSNRIGDGEGQQLVINVDDLIEGNRPGNQSLQDHVLLGIADRISTHSAAVVAMDDTLRKAGIVQMGAEAFKNQKEE